MIGKKYVTKDDEEAFARKLVRRINGARLTGGAAAGSAGVSAFTELSDAPSSYSGEGLKGVRVNAVESALEFFDLDLDSLSDVDLESAHVPSDGDVLMFDSASGRWIPAPCACGGGSGGSATNLCDLLDVLCDSPYIPSDGDVLTYDGSSGLWVPLTPTGGALSLDDLLDVDAPAPDDGDFLAFDSGTGNWINVPPPAPGSGGGGSLYPRYNRLLVHCEGANGADFIVDELGHTFRREGHAQVSTAQYKFGSSSLLFDGNGDDRFYASPDDDWDFGGLDFTVECFVRLTAVSAVDAVLIGWVNLSVRSWAIMIKNNTNLQFFWTTDGNTDNTIVAVVPGNTWDANTWYHVAVTRAAGVLYIFRDGVLLNAGGTANTAVYYNCNISTQKVPLTLGRFGDYPYGTHALNGYLDEVRILKGEAKWTGDFTPPTAEYDVQLDAW